MFQTRRLATAAAAVVSIGLPGVSLAATLHVPGDYPTIQACIESAGSGVDECVVAPGTYLEKINFLGKAITVRSSGGRDVTTIDASGIGGSVVRCTSGEGPDTVLDDFTITGGTGTNLYGRTYGGGLFNYYSSPTVTNCTFSGNTAYGGGGMLNDSSSPTVTNCTFSGNTATLGAGSGMYNEDSSPTVTNCTFSGNTAYGGGGGMVNERSSPIVTNCTFSGNTASYGGGMLNIGSIPTVANCILRGDRPDAIVNDGRSTGTVLFSDVQGGLPVGAVDGGGNINLDPMFVHPPDPGPDGTWDGVDDDYGDLRLRSGSPCIDAGDPGFVPQPGEPDLEGHARVLCGQVDMGAYEFGIGDHNCDQSVDLTDFANWSACMTGPSTADTAVPDAPGCEAFDFNSDGAVDLLDFAAFQVVLTAP